MNSSDLLSSSSEYCSSCTFSPSFSSITSSSSSYFIVFCPLASFVALVVLDSCSFSSLFTVVCIYPVALTASISSSAAFLKFFSVSVINIGTNLSTNTFVKWLNVIPSFLNISCASSKTKESL